MSNGQEQEDKQFIDEECTCGHLKSEHSYYRSDARCGRSSCVCKGFRFSHKILRKTSEQLYEEIDMLKARVEETHAERSRIVKPFYDKREQLIKDEEQATSAIYSECLRLDSELHTLRQLRDLTSDKERQEKWEGHVPKSSEEFQEWFKFSKLNPFFETGRGVSNWIGKAITRVPKVKGLIIFGGGNSDNRYYVAFDAKTGVIVGTLKIQLPQFRGDNTDATAKVNGQDVRFARQRAGYGDATPVATWVTALNERGRVKNDA